jgi:hypothetical protein
MSTKNIEFKATLNTAEMDSKIQALQQKLRTISSSTTVGDKAKSIYGEGAGMTERSQKLQESFNQRNLQYLRQEFDVRDRLFKSQENNLKQTDMQIERSKKNSKEQLDLIKERYAIEEKMLRLNIEQNAIAEKAKSIGGRDKDFGISGGGGAGAGAGATPVGGAGDGGPAGRLAAMGAMLKNAVPFIAAAAGVASFIGNQSRFQQNKSMQQAEIAQGMFRATGSDLLMSGKGAEFAVYQKERMRAMENARIAQGGMTSREIGGTVSGAVVGGIGAAGGAAIGAKFGLPLGPLGVAGGAIAGAGLGAIAGNIRSGGQLVGGVQSLIQGEGFSTGVQRARDLEFARDAQRNYEAEKAKDPFKQVAQEHYMASAVARQNILRKSGLSNRQLVGGAGIGSMDLLGNFTSGNQEGVLGGGEYTESGTMSVMQQIAASGGTSAQIGAPRGAQDLQRNYGVESAPQILGALSSKLMGGQKSLGTSDDVTRRMLAAAFSAGIDTSKMGAETERFLQASTKFVMESGARTESGMTAVAGSLANFMPEGSMAGIGVAVSAKERYEQLGGAGGPAYQQNLKLASLRQKFPGVNESDLLYISRLSPDKIAAGDDPVLKSIMEDEGISQEKMVSGHRESIDKSLTYDTESEKKLTKLRELEQFKREAPYGMKGAYDKDIAKAKAGLVRSTRGITSGNLEGEEAMQVFSGQKEEDFSGVKAPSRELNIYDMFEQANAKADQVKLQRSESYEEGMKEDLTKFKNTNNQVVIELQKLAETLAAVNASAAKGDVKGFWGNLGTVLGGDLPDILPALGNMLKPGGN